MNLDDIVKLWHKTQMGDMRECLKRRSKEFLGVKQ